MKPIVQRIVTFILMAVIISGCGLIRAPLPAADPGQVMTQAVETLSVELTVSALSLLATPFPTDEPKGQPTDTQAPPPVEATIEVATEAPTPEPTLEPTIEATQEVSTVMLRVTEDSNCRAGPNLSYGVEGYITTDMLLPVMAISQSSNWFFVLNPTYPEYHCWVNRYTSELQGDASSLPVLLDPWTPTPGVPKMEAWINHYTTYVEGKCPIQIEGVGTITSDAGVQAKYQFVNNRGKATIPAWISIPADGVYIVTGKLTFPETGKYTIQLRLLYPVRIYTDKMVFQVKCKKE